MKVNRGAARAGFTLLELLTVMGIMLVIMGAAFSAIEGIMRGAAIRSATSNLRGTLSLARQFAVTRRCKTQVLFWQDGTSAHYLMCMEGGQHVGGNGENILTMASPRSGLGGGEIVNLTKRELGVSVSQASDLQLSALESTNSTVYIKWDTGNKFGWPLRHQTHLPEGVIFKNGSGPGGAPATVCFNPDGTTPIAAGSRYDIEITELSAATPKTVKLTVEGMTGQVKVN